MHTYTAGQLVAGSQQSHNQTFAKEVDCISRKFPHHRGVFKRTHE